MSVCFTFPLSSPINCRRASERANELRVYLLLADDCGKILARRRRGVFSPLAATLFQLQRKTGGRTNGVEVSDPVTSEGRRAGRKRRWLRAQRGNATVQYDSKEGGLNYDDNGSFVLI